MTSGPGANFFITEEGKERANSVSSSDSWEAVLNPNDRLPRETPEHRLPSFLGIPYSKLTPGIKRPSDPNFRNNGPVLGGRAQVCTQGGVSKVAGVAAYKLNKEHLNNPKAPGERIHQRSNFVNSSVENKVVYEELRQATHFRDANKPCASSSGVAFKNRSAPVNMFATQPKPLVALQSSNKRVPHHLSNVDVTNFGRVLKPISVEESETNHLPDSADKMKAKLISVWNNMKYGWTVPNKTKFSYLSPIFLLGQCYQEDQIVNRFSPTSFPVDSPIEKFKLDFTSRIWLTYRRNFPSISGSNLNTDCGWGCMLRSGQMMLAQALVCHFLGRSWRCSGIHQTETSDALHRSIVKWFADFLSEMCPMSIHSLVKIGEEFGKKAGDWYGPASVAHILKMAVENGAHSSPLLDEVCVYVAQDCTVYKKDVEKLCTSPGHIQKIKDTVGKSFIRNYQLPSPFEKSVEEAITWSDAAVLDSQDAEYDFNYSTPPMSPLSRTWSNPILARNSEKSFSSDFVPNCGSVNHRSFGTSSEEGSANVKWKGLIILVPVRLGGERLNPIYIPCLKRILALDSSIGIIGGRPRHALYFVGFQDDRLIHLDPHYCQDFVDVRPSDFPLNSFHCTVPKKICLAKMDPSCTLGFYLRTQEEFQKFVQNVSPLLVPLDEKLDYPIFVINPGSSSAVNTPIFSTTPSRNYQSENTNHLDSDSDNESENFVFL